MKKFFASILLAVSFIVGGLSNIQPAGAEEISAVNFPVNVLKIRNTWLDGYHFQSCIDFKNTVPKVALAVQFEVTGQNAFGENVIRQDFIRTGEFAPGIEIDGYNYSNGRGDSENCFTMWTNGNEVSHMSITVMRVKYTDGTFWNYPSN